jgi:aminomethyltransferase
MAEFSGWQMPLQYEGVVAEHTAVRTAVGLFDVSHLGKAVVRGSGAKEFVNRCLANDLNRIPAGSAQYTLALNPAGGVTDDLIAYLRSEDEVFLIPNAANTTAVVGELQAARDAEGTSLEVLNQHRDFAVFAVQGPSSAQVLAQLGLTGPEAYMSFLDVQWTDAAGMQRPLTICRTGYTGEQGYELVPRWDDALPLWEALAAAVAFCGGRPAGLGARDTLRTEMGYALHGHELTENITPVEAGVGWAVGWKKERFWGRDALLAQKAAGAPRKAVGLLARERGVPRADVNVLDATGNVVGRTTSGTFSPTLQNGIALALVEPNTTEGTELALDLRGRRMAVTVVRPPFVQVRTKPQPE